MKKVIVALSLLVAVSSSTRAADANKDEMKAIATIEKLGATVKIAEEMEGPARLKVTFDKIDDKAATTLKGMTQIAVLISGNASGLTDRGITLLAGIPNLTELTLEKANITSAGIAPLKALKNLKSLSLHGASKLNDSGVAVLKEIKGLTELDLSKTALTDASFAHFKAMESLKTLYLLDTKVTDKGLVNIKGHKSLKMLGVGMTSITPKAAQEVETATEGLRIRR